MRDGLRGQELTIMDFNVIRLSFLLLLKHKKTPRVRGFEAHGLERPQA